MIRDINSDGVKDVVFTTFLRHIEVLDGHHGHPVAGWPFTLPNSVFHSSPLAYDINGDGFQEIGIVTYNAEIIWFNENGTPVFGKTLKIPGLKVNKNWYAGLDMQAANSELYNKKGATGDHYGSKPSDEKIEEDEPEVSDGVLEMACHSFSCRSRRKMRQMLPLSTDPRESFYLPKMRFQEYFGHFVFVPAPPILQKKMLGIFGANTSNFVNYCRRFHYLGFFPPGGRGGRE